MTDRAGVTLPELVLVSWLFALVLLALARFAAAQGGLAAISYDQARGAEMVRTADLVLEGELRALAATDLTVIGDSVRLRAVRGVGPVCGRAGAQLRVRYRGVRRPEPAKDSVLILTDWHTDGEAYGLMGVAVDPDCGGYRLELSGDTRAASGLVLVFETGSYHLSGGALRYRRGAGGRQPVTEGVLGGGAFELKPDRLRVHLPLHADSLPRDPRRAPIATVGLLNRGVGS